MIVNNSDLILKLISAHKGQLSHVVYVSDNAGTEFLMDLVAIDFLISSNAVQKVSSISLIAVAQGGGGDVGDCSGFDGCHLRVM